MATNEDIQLALDTPAAVSRIEPAGRTIPG